MDSDDLIEGCDAIRQDMADHQRSHGKEVTATANHALAAATFERIERQRLDAKEIVTAATDPKPRITRAETSTRDGQHGRYLFSTAGSDDIKHRSATPAEHWFMTHAMPRINLLLTKLETGPLGQPSWSQRTLAVMETQSRVSGLRARGLHISANDLQRRFMFELLELLEASNAVFGEWKADHVKNPLIGWTPSKG